MFGGYFIEKYYLSEKFGKKIADKFLGFWFCFLTLLSLFTKNPLIVVIFVLTTVFLYHNFVEKYKKK